jgi:hypothetical protein
MIYEIREYTVVPGRLGQLIKRFNDHALKLFPRHGMECVFISMTDLGENSNEIVYVMKFDSYADMEQRWNSFLADPEWQAAKAASEAGGPLVAKLRRRVVNPGPFGG